MHEHLNRAGIARVYLHMSAHDLDPGRRVRVAQMAADHGVTVSEIARTYGVSEDAVRGMLQREGDQ